MAFRKGTEDSHWSVDFVEHLRTVHFALLTLSVALIILLSGHSEGDIAKGMTQAGEILDLHENWKEYVSSIYLDAAHQFHDPRSNIAIPITIPGESFPDRQLVSIDIDPEEYRRYSPWKFRGVDMAAAPRTLLGFARWWDSLHRGAKIYIPDFRNPDAPFGFGYNSPTSIVCNSHVVKTRTRLPGALGFAGHEPSCYEANQCEPARYLNADRRHKSLNLKADDYEFLVTIRRRFTY